MNRSIQTKQLFLILLLVIVTAVIISCSADEDRAVEEVEVTRVVSEEVIIEGETVEESEVELEEEPFESVEDSTEEEMEEAEEMLDEEDDFVQAVDSEGAIGDVPPTPEDGPKVEETRAPSNGESVNQNEPNVRAPAGEEATSPNEASVPITTATPSQQLTAGELDDNTNFGAYLDYLATYNKNDVLPIDVTERVRIVVEDVTGTPILGAQITIDDAAGFVTTLQTHSDGSTLFFPNAFGDLSTPFTLTVAYDGLTAIEVVEPSSSDETWNVTLPEPVAETAVSLQILFLLDATGSMVDEINQLKENIQFIAEQIDALPSNVSLEIGMVAYRDRGAPTLLQVEPFTNDILRFSQSLEKVEATGGGDYPEDLHSALEVGLVQLAWQTNDRIGLIFLVSDAPPHLDYGQPFSYPQAIAEANNLGVKIYPIASSGLNEQGAYIFRQMAQMTNGRFLFITDSASGGSDDGGGLGDSSYRVEALDSLILEIITQELSFLNSQ